MNENPMTVPSTEDSSNYELTKETKKLPIINRTMEVLAPISVYTTSQYQPLGSGLPGVITSRSILLYDFNILICNKSPHEQSCSLSTYK